MEFEKDVRLSEKSCTSFWKNVYMFSSEAGKGKRETKKAIGFFFR